MRADRLLLPPMLPTKRKMCSKVIVGDDHSLFRDALAELAASQLPEAEVESAASLSEVMQMAESGEDPDLFLLDLIFPGMEIPVSLPELRRRYPKSSIILVSMVDDEETISLAMRSGGDGFIHKAARRERCIDAIDRVLKGEYVIEREDAQAGSADPLGGDAITLTARQRDVLELLAKGTPNKLMARDLGISHLTVRLHVSALLRIFGVTRRAEVAPKARMLGLLDTN